MSDFIDNQKDTDEPFNLSLCAECDAPLGADAIHGMCSQKCFDIAQQRYERFNSEDIPF